MGSSRADSAVSTKRRATPALPEGLYPPPWVSDRLGPAVRHTRSSFGNATLTLSESRHGALATVVVEKAIELDSLSLQRATVDAYRTLQEAISKSKFPHPLRFWNFIPDIHARMGDDIDRYMSFNAGRFAAFCDWFGGPDAFDRSIPAATGVGYDGTDMALCLLGGAEPGLHLHNPRQRRPYRYSRRFGPYPPCFARATMVASGDESLVLVGGTASVLDESSVHINNLDAQIDETLHNLCRLLDTATKMTAVRQPPRNAAALLACLRDIRVYYPEAEHKERIRAALGRRLPHLTDMEFVRADLCRAELLVEIEGTAVV